MTDGTKRKISESKKGKLPWNKGLKMPQKTREKMMGSKNPMWGTHHSEEWKHKMSEIHKGNKVNLGKCLTEEHKKKISDSHKGEKNHMYGKHLSEESKHRISEANKHNLYNLGKKHSFDSRLKMSKSHIQFMSSGKLKLKDTLIELAIENELIKRHIPYLKQTPLLGITIVDFLLPNKIVIYCDGDYWHNIPKVKNRDINQDFMLGFNGYRVFRFTETEIKKSAKNCIEKIF